MAREVEVERRSSRVIATVPFGVGQFQNGDTGFGIFLAASEGVFFLGSVATLIAYFALPNDTTPPSADLPGLRRAERSLAILNWVSSGLFGTLAVIGIVDAHLRFEPVNRSTRERELPPELDELDDLIPEPEGEPTPAPTSAVRLELGLTGLRLRF
jgi:hypothetical protein